jgi:uncharacterized protein with PIN domain
MVTLVCPSCGEFVEVKEPQVLEEGTTAIVREGSEFSCSSCKRVFHPGDELVLDYELGDHSTLLWMRKIRQI